MIDGPTRAEIEGEETTPTGVLLTKPDNLGDTNKALELTDALAPFLTPMPSDDSEFIKTVAEFALEMSPAQNAVLTKLDLLAIDLIAAGNFVQAKKIHLKIAEWKKNKRYHDARFFVSDAIQSMSWRKFATGGQMSASVSKNTNQ